ncbi:DUF333 domain-containing protein [Dyella sp. C9]|uniref:putative hemolysin n=1 Tax=Dyella sp. C9 TaxID=2202154 RepID=UPI0018E51A06|nr:DUF333 domain-containing protein [Dyella sp. C9]
MLGLIACATAATTPPVTQPASGSTVGLANPASVNCARQGGRLDLRKDAKGNVSGICVFPDGRRCEEWSLFRDKQCVKPGDTLPAHGSSP